MSGASAGIRRCTKFGVFGANFGVFRSKFDKKFSGNGGKFKFRYCDLSEWYVQIFS